MLEKAFICVLPIGFSISHKLKDLQTPCTPTKHLTLHFFYVGEDLKGQFLMLAIHTLRLFQQDLSHISGCLFALFTRSVRYFALPNEPCFEFRVVRFDISLTGEVRPPQLTKDPVIGVQVGILVPVQHVLFVDFPHPNFVVDNFALQILGQCH
jgi:hypothetical protein